MRKLSFTLVFLFLSFPILAHEGGHYHKGDGTVFNSWRLLNGQEVKGNFAMGNREFIMLEQEEGHLLKIAIATLSIQDQKLALFKVRKLEGFNRDHFGSPIVPVRDIDPVEFPNVLSLLVSLTLVLLIFSVKPLRIFDQLPQGSITVWLLLLLIGVFACSKSAEFANPDSLRIFRISILF